MTKQEREKRNQNFFEFLKKSPSDINKACDDAGVDHGFPAMQIKNIGDQDFINKFNSIIKNKKLESKALTIKEWELLGEIEKSPENLAEASRNAKVSQGFAYGDYRSSEYKRLYAKITKGGIKSREDRFLKELKKACGNINEATISTGVNYAYYYQKKGTSFYREGQKIRKQFKKKS